MASESNPYSPPTANVADAIETHIDLAQCKIPRLRKRFLAYLIDNLILTPIHLLDNLITEQSSLPIITTITLICGLVYPVYSLILHSFWGKTLGKLIVGIRVVGTDGTNPPGMIRILKRDSIYTVSSVIMSVIAVYDHSSPTWGQTSFGYPQIVIWLSCVIGAFALIDIIWMACNSKRKALHDLMGSTIVIEPQKKAQA